MNDLYDRQTAEVLRRTLRRESNCIDIGCNQGDILRAILAVAPQGRHYAFEPIPELAAALKSDFPSVNVMQLALSDTAGEVPFQRVVSNSSYSGLLRRHYDNPDEEVQEIRVSAARLDDVLPPQLPIDFIKIDVEGAELQVFRGALRTLREHRPLVIFEHGFGAADCYGTTPDAVYELLQADAGLSIFLMKDWLEQRAPLTRQEFVRQFETGENFYFMACIRLARTIAEAESRCP
jgi:FkbM family methyltransferase